MSFTPRPCPHCGGVSFHLIPGVQLDVAHATTLFGIAASQHIKGERWTFTIVSCTQCGRSDTFTNDPASLAALYAGSQIVTTTRTS